MHVDVDEPVRQNPFPGLRPFTTEEDYLFFGREEQTTELLGLLRENRFLAVVGTSGSGKSSLVRAGLLPALHGGTMARAGSAWEVLVLRPGGDPITNLARALIDADLYDPDDLESLPRIVATLNRSRLGLVEAVRQSDLPEGTNLLVVVDQFEELFRFRQAGVTHQETAAAFVKLLLAAAREPDQRIYIAITMRSDYLGECSHIGGLAEAVNDGEYLIPRLSRDQRRAAIEKPVSVGGGTIAHRLVQKLLNDVGDDADHLPVLQHALMRIFDYWAEDHADDEPLDLRHYERAGGLQEALSRHSDEVYDELPTDRLRKVAEKVFKALTERGPDNRGIRRPTRLDTLCAIADATPAEVAAVIEAFRRAGRTFLMPMADVQLEPHTVIDISHESLMRVWTRLDRWVEEESQSARIYRRLADTAALHAEGKAGIYHDPDLQIALTWRETERPTEAWAARYHAGFEQALAFLEKSRAVQHAEAQRLEAARRRELEQAKKLAAAERTRAQVQKRSARRLRWLASGVAVVAGLAFLAFGVALVAWQESRNLAHREAQAAADERTARAEAEEAKNREAKEKDQAERARKNADEALQKAEENFAKARAAVNDYLTAVSEDERLKAPGLQGLRIQLLQSALQFYQEFLKERGNDPTLKRELAGVYRKIAEIYRDLSQFSAANQSYAQARRLYEALLAESPSDAELQHGLAICLHSLGVRAQAISILEKLIQPDDPKYHAELGDFYNIAAIEAGKIDRTKELEYLSKALTVRERLVRLRPDDPEARIGFAGSINNIAIRLKEDRHAEALVHIRKAVDEIEAAHRLRPAHLLTVRYLTIGLNNVAKWAKLVGEPEVALAAQRRRVEVLDRRARDNPTVPGVDAELVGGYATLLYELHEAGRSDEVATTTERARIRLAETTEETTEFFRQVSYFHLTAHSLALARAKADPSGKANTEREAAAAVNALRQHALAGWRDPKWMRTDSRTAPLRERADFKELLAQVDQLALAEASARTLIASPEEKRVAREKVLTALATLAGPAQAARFVRRNLAQARQDLAQALLESGHEDEARLAFDEALLARQRLVEEAPSNEQLRADLAQSQSATGDLFAAAGKLADAVTTWDKALTTLEGGLKTNPNSIAFQTALMQRVLHVADQCGKVGLWDKATKHYRRAFEIQAPTEFLHWYFYSGALLEVQDAAGHRALVEQVAPQVAANKGLALLHLGRIILLMPDAGTRYSDALKQLAQGITYKERDWPAWCQGMAFVRLGQADKGLSLLSTVKDPLQKLPAQALALHQLGKKAAAADALHQADLIAEQRLRDSLPLEKLKVPDAWWSDWLAFRALRREAHQAIHAKSLPDSAYERLFKGRVLMALGEADRAETEFAAAVTLHPDDADVWLTRSRVFGKLGQNDRMAADLLRAQQLKGADPRTWVETGRMLAERGESEKADDALARASVLGKGELNRFLEAGWWVVGPYPDRMDMPCPPEINPDPSKPVSAVGDKRELKWQAVGSSPHTGHIQWPYSMGGKSKASSYALTYVYADRDRTAALHLWPKFDARVWVNGQVAFAGFGEGKNSGIIEIPVSLRKGRNTLLVRNRHDGEAWCECAFLDAPIRRGYELVRMGLWAEAADAFAEADRRSPLHEYPSRLRIHALFAAGREAEARDVFAELVRRHDRSGSVDASIDLTQACLLPPDQGQDRERWLAATRRFVAANPAEMYRYHRLAHACFRAGKFGEAEVNLRKALAKEQLYFQPLLASILHQLGKNADARKTLDAMEARHARLVQEALAANPYRPAQYWEEELWYQVMRREARTLILGKDSGPSMDEVALAKKANARQAELDKIEDQFVRLAHQNPDQPRLWIDQGRRLGQAKQWDESARAFAKAIELAPKDWHVWKERGRAYAELAKWDEAAADFVTALKLAPAPTAKAPQFPWAVDRAGIDDLLVRWDEVFDRVTKARPKDTVLWARRAQHFARLGQWPDAEKALQRFRELAPSNHWGPYRVVPLLVSRGDVEGYRQVVAQMQKQFSGTTGWSSAEKVVRTALLVPGESTDFAALAALLDAVNDILTDTGVASRSMRLARCLLAYRSGNFAGAVHQVTAAGAPMDDATPQGAEALILLAMAQQQLGEPVAARESLVKARAIVDRKAARPDLGWLYDDNTWEGWVRCRLLIREAEKLVATDQVVAAGPGTLSLQEETARRDRKDRADRISLQAALAQIRLDVGQRKEAEAELRAVLAERGKIAAEEPANPNYQADLATTQRSLGQLLVSSGRIDEGVKELQEAVAVLEKVAAGNPHDARHQMSLATNLFSIGEFHWKAGRLAEGRQAWRKALDSLEAARGASAKDTRLAKTAVGLELVAARAYAELGLWTEASAHFRRAFEVDPVAGNTTDRFYHALLLVFNGDEAEYRKYCGALYERSGQNLQDWWSARMLVLRPGALADPKNVVVVAQEARKSPSSDDWSYLHLGLAQVRANQPKAGSASIQEFENASQSDWQASWPALALVRHKAGQTDEAKELLRKGEDWYAGMWSKHLAADTTGLPRSLTWSHWAFFYSFRQEALATVTGKPPVADAWLHLHRGRVYSKLGQPELADAEFQAAVKAQPDDPRIWLARSHIYAALGKKAEAQADRDRVVPLTEGTLIQRPDDQVSAEALASLLIAKVDTKWRDLKPAALKSEGGATLTIQPDSSVIVGGVNPEQDVYVIEAEVQGRIGAIRLEAIADPKLSQGGSGRARSGNFLLTDFRVTVRDSAVQWSRASADYSQSDFDVADAIDGDPVSGWGVFPQVEESHAAVFVPAQPLGGSDKTRLTIRLAFQNPEWTKHGLGHFRLSVADGTEMTQQTEWFQAASTPHAKVGAAYLALGDARRGADFLTKAIKANPKPACTDWLVLALAHVRLNEADHAKSACVKAVEALPKSGFTAAVRPLLREVVFAMGKDHPGAQVLMNAATTGEPPALWNAAIQQKTEQASAYLARGNWYGERARWKEASADLIEAFRLEPSAYTGMRLGILLVQTGDLDRYRAHCQAMLERFSSTEKNGEADQTLKTVLFMPETRADAKQLARLAEAAVAGDDKQDWYEWYLFAKGLHAYRSENFDDALSACRESRRRSSATKGSAAALSALNLVVEAMALQRAGDATGAKRALTDARSHLDLHVPGMDFAWWHDWLAAQILYREAEALIARSKFPASR